METKRQLKLSQKRKREDGVRSGSSEPKGTRPRAKTHQRRGRPADAGSGNDKGSALFVASVEKAMTILFAFGGPERRLTLSRVSALTGMHPSAAQRFLFTLHTLGLLQKDETSRQYAPTSRLLQLGTIYLRGHELIERATPYLIEANARLRASVSLVELVGTDIIYIARALGRHPSNRELLLGTRLPAYCTAGGRAILAFTKAAAEIVERSEIRAFTETTITDKKKIEAAIGKVARQGYAISNQEYLHGDISVAAPLFDYSGNVIAAISSGVSGPEWTPERVEREIAPIIIETANAVSGIHGRFYRSLGGEAALG